MKTYLLLICFVFSIQISFGQNNIWQGASMSNWNNVGNWSLGWVPLTTDTVIFNNGNECNVDINPSIASLRVSGAGGNLFSTGGSRIIAINNSGAASPVLHVATASTLTLGTTGGVFAVSLTTFGSSTTNNAQVQGTLFFGRASTWTVSSGPATTDIDVSGTVVVTATSSTASSVFLSSAVATLRFLSGSSLLWGRNGGFIPVADFRNGSSIFVSAITNSMVSFNSNSLYDGLITWSCPSQTISGAAAVLLQTPTESMDSIYIISTGSGTLRLFSEPQGYTLGHVEVRGGTLELSSPVPGFVTRFGIITGNLKITGGNVIGNATYAGDPGGNPMRLTINGNFIMSSGSFNLTNRNPAIVNPPFGGAFQMHIKGDVAQSAGLVTTTSAIGSQNYIMLDGALIQNLELTNFTGPGALIINNAAGVVLQNDLFISYVLLFLNGVLTSSSSNLLTIGASSQAFGTSNESFVDGPVSKIGNTAFDFPVGKTTCGPSGTKKGYAAIGISGFTGGLATDRYTAEYIRGNAHAMGAITTGAHHISACDYWTLIRNNGTSTVSITLNWQDSINNCTNASPYIDNVPSLTVAHFNTVSWNAIGTIGINSGNSASGSVTWGLPQSNEFGIFAIASVDFNNPLPITINYFNGVKNNGSHLLNWKLTCVSTASATVEIERSSDGINYSPVYSIFATAVRCQQPFDFTDNQPAKGINYYRLRMTDINGKVTYSSVVHLINASKGIDVMNIAPNPIVNGNFNLKISAAEKTQMELLITDMQGRVLQRQSANMIAGFNLIPMNVHNLAAGTYQLFGNSEDGRTRVLRFVIQ